MLDIIYLYRYFIAMIVCSLFLFAGYHFCLLDCFKQLQAIKKYNAKLYLQVKVLENQDVNVTSGIKANSLQEKSSRQVILQTLLKFLHGQHMQSYQLNIIPEKEDSKFHHLHILLRGEAKAVQVQGLLLFILQNHFATQLINVELEVKPSFAISYIIEFKTFISNFFIENENQKFSYALKDIFCLNQNKIDKFKPIDANTISIDQMTMLGYAASSHGEAVLIELPDHSTILINKKHLLGKEQARIIDVKNNFLRLSLPDHQQRSIELNIKAEKLK